MRLNDYLDMALELCSFATLMIWCAACYLCSRDGAERSLAGGCEAAGGPAQPPQQDQRALPGAAAHHRGLPHLLRHAAHGDPLAHHYRLVRRQHRLQGIYRMRENILILITTVRVFQLP